MKIKHLLFSILSTCFLLVCADVVQAQIAPSQGDRVPVSDNTLNTQVDRFGNNFNITGGLQRGQNVFHSFSDFSVPTNGAANFFNPAGNQSIITRVTGNNFSDINGLVNTNGANFFLINPSGIIFGPNASFNVGKSFVATTANSIDLVDGNGGRYNFGARNGNDAPLISVNSNVLFNVDRLNIVNGSNSGIINYGNINPNNPGQYIGLIGGNINLLGGSITAAGGRVDLGGINTTGAVSIGSTGLLFAGENIGRSNVFMRNGASVSVRARDTLTSVDPVFFTNATSNGSSINIGANNVELVNAGSTEQGDFTRALDAGLEANSGVKTNAGGDIKIDATGLVSLDNSGIGNTLRKDTEGNIGGIKIEANRLTLTNQSFISTLLSGTGSAGNIDIKTTGDISISGSTPSSTAPITDNSPISSIAAQSGGKGGAGKVTINTQGKLILSNRAIISSSVLTGGVGNGQNITIFARELDMSNGSSIGAILIGEGKAGNIDIKTTGDISISGSTPSSTAPVTDDSPISSISAQTSGKGDGGKVTINSQGKLSLSNNASIINPIDGEATGNSQGISISAREIDLSNGSFISASNIGGTGNAGNIDIKTTGDIRLDGGTSKSAFINSATSGKGNSGAISIDTQGKLILTNEADISNSVAASGKGQGQNITISAQGIDLINGSKIRATLSGEGKAGNIDIKTTGDISISGSTPSSTAPVNEESPLSAISAQTSGKGDSGKITIKTDGKLSLSNRAAILNSIGKEATGNSQGISISAREIDLRNRSSIFSSNLGGTGNSGNIDITTTGDINISGSTPSSTASITDKPLISDISAQTAGKGDAGKVTINAQGKLSLSNRANISNAISDNAVGNSRGINISAREIDLNNRSSILSSNFGGTGNAGNIEIKTIGDIRLNGGVNGNFSGIDSDTIGQGNSGAISVDAGGKLVLINQGTISNGVGKNGIGNAGDIKINARELDLSNNSFILSANFGGKGNAGNIAIKTTGDVSISGSTPSSNTPITDSSPLSFITTLSTSDNRGDRAGSIRIDAGGKIALSNRVYISTESKNSTGGDLFITAGKYLLLRNDSDIKTDSASSTTDNGGNITIDSPIIVASPNGNSNITADAKGGNGGNINITSQGLFGIGYRANGVNSPLSNDITASSTFGQSGAVSVNTPDVDPGKDSAELPEAPADKTNQVTQACSPSKEQNTFYVTGRGGKAPTGEETLSNDEVWLDDRNSTTTATAPVKPTVVAKQYQPAQGWVFDKNGKVRLIATDKSPVNNTLPACPPLPPPANIQSSVPIDF